MDFLEMQFLYHSCWAKWSCSPASRWN